MDTKMYICIMICSIIFSVNIGAIYIFYAIIGPYLEEKNKIKNKEIENKKMEIYMSISPEMVEQELDKYFERYIRRYILYKFISNKITFINIDQCEEMVKDITRLVVLEMSDIYVFYMKIISDIKDDEDFIKHINSRVKNKCIEEVSNFNSTNK